MSSARDITTELIENCAKHQVVVVQGVTASGKSSILPLAVLEGAAVGKKDFVVFTTQPRRLHAVRLAKHVANSIKTSQGSFVPGLGTSLRFVDKLK